MSVHATMGVVPVLVGPLQVLLALLPALLASLGSLVLALFKPSTFKLLLRLAWRLKLPLLVLAALGYGLVLGVGALLPGRGGKASAAEAVRTDWPAFRGGLRRDGVAPGSPSPVQGGVNWAFTADTRTFYSSPAVVGNRVYISSADKGVFTDRGAIYCLDADNGAVVWKSAPPGFRATFSSPSVAGKYLVCGEGLHYTRDGRVVCLDVTQQGKLLWEFRTQSHVESSPCILSNRVYIGAGDDGYYCFDLEPDSAGKARLVWHTSGVKMPDAETAPIAHEGRVYAGLGLDGRALVCLNADTGAELWRVPTPYPVFTPPTIVGDKVVFGMGNGNFIETADQAAVKELDKLRKAGASAAELAAAQKSLRAGGEVWCVDMRVAAGMSTPGERSKIRNPKSETSPNDGNPKFQANQGTARSAGFQPASPAPVANDGVLWRYRLPEVVLGAVAADTNRLYFGSRDGRFYCLSQEGKEIGKYDARAVILTSPAVADTHVYFVTETGRLIALAKDTLQPVWEMALGAQGPFLSSPTVARGRVYVGTQEDGLLCVGQSKSTQTRPVWAGFLGGPGKPGGLGVAQLPDRGTLLWRWPKPAEASGDEPPPPVITAPAAAIESLLCVPVAAGSNHGMLCLKNSADARQGASEAWLFRTSNGVSFSPATCYAFENPAMLEYIPPAPSVFFVDGRAGDQARSLHRLRASDGAVFWKHPVATEASGEFVLVEPGTPMRLPQGSLLIQDKTNSLACLDVYGGLVWRQEVGTLRGPPAVRDNVVVVALQSPAAVAAKDLPTGQPLWRRRCDVTTGPVVERDRIYVGTSTGVAALRLVDGSEIFSTTNGPPAQPLVCAKNFIAYVNAGSEAVLLDARDGKLVVKIPQALPTVPPLLTRDTLLFVTKDSLMTYNFASAQTQRWMATAWLGTLTSPVVISEASVYFATDKRGFIRAGKR
jgi:outer membrane protein assembly factor BamB